MRHTWGRLCQPAASPLLGSRHITMTTCQRNHGTNSDRICGRVKKKSRSREQMHAAVHNLPPVRPRHRPLEESERLDFIHDQVRAGLRETVGEEGVGVGGSLSPLLHLPYSPRSLSSMWKL